MSTWLTYLLTLSIASVFNTVFQTLSSFFDKNLYCPRFVWIWFCFQPYIRRRQLWAEKWRFYLLLVSPCPPPATVPPVSTTSPHRQTCFLSWATLPYHCHTPSRPLKQYSFLCFRTEREHQNILLGCQYLDRKCLFAHSVCANFSLIAHSVCANFGLIAHSPVYSVILLK